MNKEVIIISLLISLSACGAKSKNADTEEMAHSSATPAAAVAMTDNVKKIQISNALPALDPSDTEAQNLDCLKIKIHIGDFGPRDSGGPVGEYVAITDDGKNYKGSVTEDGNNYVFLTGHLADVNAIIEDDKIGNIDFKSKDIPGGVPYACHPA